MGKYICQRPIHPGELLKEENASSRSAGWPSRWASPTRY